MDNLIKSALFGTGGAIIGGIYQLCSTYATTEESTSMIKSKHDILSRDRYLCSLLGSIEADFLRSDPVALVKVINSIEDLIHLNTTLSSSKYIPCVNDRVCAFLCFQHIKSAIQRFITEVELVYEPRAVIHIQHVVKNMMECVEAYVTKVVMLTREIHMHVPR